MRSLLAFLLLANLLPNRPVPAASNSKGDTAMAFSLQSNAFPNGGDIPKQYTCEGQDISPALSWDDPPAGAQSFVLIADDPDAPAGTWVHWVAYDIPASRRSLPQGVGKADEIAGGGRQGLNDFRKLGYGGPCPPPGKPHRYYFRLFALNAALNLTPRATRKEVEKAMQPLVLGHAEYVGRYRR
jgi:Raf kinase inhibitor-like YbhB/YbcL family protein